MTIQPQKAQYPYDNTTVQKGQYKYGNTTSKSTIHV